MNRKFQVKTLPSFEELQSAPVSPPRWLYETRNLFVEKVTEQERADALACLELKLNQLCPSTDSRKFVLSDLAYLNKNGGFNALVSRVFFQNGASIEEVESKRLHTLAVLKTRNVVEEMSFCYLYSIYKNVYLGRLNLEYCEEQSDAWRKYYKSIMTSLKKMMVFKTKKPKKSLKPSKDSQRYTVNLDVKHLIKCCETKSKILMEKSLACKIHDMIQKTRNGWAGPRLWKIVHEQKWSSSDVQMFIQMFSASFQEYAHPRSEPRKLRVAVERILENLTALNSSTKIENSSTQDDWDELMLQMPAYSKKDVEIELQNYEEVLQYVIQDYHSAGFEHRSVSVDDGTLQELSFL